MLKRFPLILTALLFLTTSTATADEIATDTTTAAVEVGQDTEPLAVIDGPTESPAGELVEFDAGGSVGGGYKWLVDGQNPDGRWRVYEDGRILIFASPEPGQYKIILSVALDNQSDLTLLVLQNGGPGPDPDPDPIPPPVPPGEVTMCVITETEDRTAAEATMLGKLRAYLRGSKLTIQFADQHKQSGSTEETPEWMEPYLEAVTTRPVKLPALVVLAKPDDSGDSSVVAVESIGKMTGDQVIDLVEKHGGKP